MNQLKYIFRSLSWYRKQHLALLAGTLLASMVLTGALIMGDSVKGSLTALAQSRLGKVKYIVAPGQRVVRDSLAPLLSERLEAPASAILMLEGIAINQESSERENQVQVLGIDSTFWQFAEEGFEKLATGDVILNQKLAQRLSLDTGSMLLVRVEKASLIPLNVPLAPEKQASVSFRLRVAGIAGDKSLGRFSLRSNQVEPYSIFLDRHDLVKAMELEGRCNVILLGNGPGKELQADSLKAALDANWSLRDAGLHLQDIQGKAQYELVSDRIFIDSQYEKVLDSMDIPHEKILTYLANSIRTGTDTTPYSFVSALSSGLLPAGMQEDEIVVNQWLADDLHLQAGDSLCMDYYHTGSLRRFSERSFTFRVHSVIPTQGSVSEPSLMPEIPGLSDAGNCRDWDAGVEVDFKRVRDKDEDYWDAYRGSPKALLLFEKGEALWSNRFGNASSLRFNFSEMKSDSLSQLLQTAVSPAMLGVSILAIYAEGVKAAANAVDFGQLFLGLSFFIIISSVLLILLLYSMAVMARSSETALLSGLGFKPVLLLRLHFGETGIVMAAGCILGSLAGILYTKALIVALNSVWQAAVQTSMISLHIHAGTLFLGGGIAFITAFLSVLFAQKKRSARRLAGLLQSSSSIDWLETRGSLRMSWGISLVGLSLAAILLIWSLASNAYENAALFLSAGALFLIGSIAGISVLFNLQKEDENEVQRSLLKLALKSAGRNQRRSLSVILLLAIGVFSIVLTGAYRKNFTGTTHDRSSGTGGFLFWAETSLPFPSDLNVQKIRNEYFGATKLACDSFAFVQFLSLEGDDASCLNLNQVSRPRILGVNPQLFSRRMAFSFAKLHPSILKDDPWKGLIGNAESLILPAFADQSVIQYGLGKSLGDTLFYQDEFGKRIGLLLAGGLDNSIFQGSILVDEARLSQHFPSLGGSRVMLLEAPDTCAGALEEMLRESLQDYGIILSNSQERLSTFHSVENTYLSVFMILGSLGLLLGIAGLAVVLFRNMLGRRHELAVYFALGIRRRTIQWMVYLENLLLFGAGLIIGIIAAGLAILPSWMSPVFETHTATLGIILAALFIGGLLWIWLPADYAGRHLDMESLRND